MLNRKLVVSCCVFTLAFSSFIADSATFNTQKLKDKSIANYFGFEGKFASYSDPINTDRFEKVAADFNGDGIDDILSFGGFINICEPGCTAVLPPPLHLPFDLMLSKEGQYVPHYMGLKEYAQGAFITDFDGDADLDLVSQSGHVLLNDGEANFSKAHIFSEEPVDRELHVADWNQNGLLDIVAGDVVYLQLTEGVFEKRVLNDFESDEVLVFNGNGDSAPDLASIVGRQIIIQNNDGDGNLSLRTRFSIVVEGFKLSAANFDSGPADELLIAYAKDNKIITEIWDNDGNGNFTNTDYEDNVRFDIPDISNVDLQVVDITQKRNTSEIFITTMLTNSATCELQQYLIGQFQYRVGQELEYYSTFHALGYGRDAHLLTNPKAILPLFADLNGNGSVEIIVPGNTPTILLQPYGSGTYYEANISGSSFNNRIDVEDFDGDGNMDILSGAQFDKNCEALPNDEIRDSLSFRSSIYSGKGSIWLGDGQAGYEPINFLGGSDTIDYVVNSTFSKFSDFNQDGRMDVFLTYPPFNDRGLRTFYYPGRFAPEVSRMLPNPAREIQVADLTGNDGLDLVMIADTPDALLHVLSYEKRQFTEQVILPFGAEKGEIILADMDGDGLVDIVANRQSDTESLTIWYNQGDYNFTASEAFASGVKSMGVADFNFDGKLDIYASNETQEIWFNQGEKSFQPFSKNTKFLIEHLPDRFVANRLSPDKIQLADVNQDGKQDVFAYVNHRSDQGLRFEDETVLYLFINNSKADTVSFYLTYRQQIVEGIETDALASANVRVADLNSDGLLDIVSGSSRGIDIIYQQESEVFGGLFYDPLHSGHGFSIDQVAQDDLYYSVFYTFDETGRPEWFSKLNRLNTQFTSAEDLTFLTKVNNQNRIRYKYDYAARKASFDTDYLGWLNYNVVNQNQLTARFFDDQAEISWPVSALISQTNNPATDYSGIWWAGSDDSGWGISLSFLESEEQETVVAVVYFYDAQGNPRWVIGTADNFEANTDMTILMDQVIGYERTESPVELTRLAAGSITIRINEASKDLSEAGVLSTDIRYLGLEGGRWIRNNIPFALFSNPIE